MRLAPLTVQWVGFHLPGASAQMPASCSPRKPGRPPAFGRRSEPKIAKPAAQPGWAARPCSSFSSALCFWCSISPSQESPLQVACRFSKAFAGVSDSAHGASHKMPGSLSAAYISTFINPESKHFQEYCARVWKLVLGMAPFWSPAIFRGHASPSPSLLGGVPSTRWKQQPPCRMRS